MAVILVTRPDTKGEQLVAQLQQLGHQAVSFPLLKLEAIAVSSAELSPLAEADKLIFISQDAVKALYALKPNLKHQPEFYAVGDKTADVIFDLFQVKARTPKQHDSEGLLALHDLQAVEQKNIVLIKGQDGRPLIAQTLKSRGAFVHSLALYRRQPSVDKVSDNIKQWQQQKIDSIVLTSNAAVDAIFNELAANELEWLKTCRFYVASNRIADYLATQAISPTNIQICAGASDEAIVAGITSQESLMSDEKIINSDATVTTQDKESTSKPKSSRTEPLAKKTQQTSGAKWVAALAILLSLGACGAVAYSYVHQQQYSNQLFSQLNDENQALANRLQALQNLADQQAAQLNAQLRNSETNIQQALKTTEQQIAAQLSQTLEQKNNQQVELNPFEVKSLHRMAIFKVQSEQNYQAAIAILQQLDHLLAEHAGHTRLREAIHQDIQALAAVQNVPVEQLYLNLYGITQQLPKLPLNMVQLPDLLETQQATALSDDISDWQSNLKRSWRLLVDDFIKVRERSALIEPLLSPQEQTLVRQRLAFYVTQSQSALLNQQVDVFKASIAQAQQIIADYYDQQASSVVNITQQLATLAEKDLQFNPQVELVSAVALQEWAQ